MSDYKEMYLKMVRATEQAINTLIAVQQECEEMYLNAQDIPLELFPHKEENNPM